VLGWSYLAGVAVRDALSHPDAVERLILVAPIAPHTRPDLGRGHDAPPGALAHLDQLRAAGVDRSDPRRFCEAWREVYLPLQLADPGESFARVRSRPCDHPNEHPDRVVRSLAHVFLDLGIYDWRPELEALDRPVLVIGGQADEAGREAGVEWVTTLPDARLLEVPGACRLPWVERPDLFLPAVSAFRAGDWPPGARR
jgi:pimeloyl-ACP methyl ester carboxylesterase